MLATPSIRVDCHERCVMDRRVRSARTAVLLILALLLLQLPSLAATSQSTVLAVVDVFQIKGSGRVLAYVVPIAIHESGRYRSGELVGGGRKQIEVLMARSVLNRVREFSLYDGGEVVGTVNIERLAPIAAGCQGVVGGVGTLRWRKAPNLSRGESRSISLDADYGPALFGDPNSREVEATHLSFSAISVLSTKRGVPRGLVTSRDRARAS